MLEYPVNYLVRDGVKIQQSDLVVGDIFQIYVGSNAYPVMRVNAKGQLMDEPQDFKYTGDGKIEIHPKVIVVKKFKNTKAWQGKKYGN